MVSKNKEEDYLEGYNEETVKFFSNCGFNLIRLGIIWDGVEPSPLIYSDDYLYKISNFMDICDRYNIHVFLDMHQDLYARQFSDGAPDWACLTENEEHVTGDVWSDAYLLSGAVQNAFTNFWSNKKSEVGIGLLDHYEKMWVHILDVLGNHPALIGCDFINEPFIGVGAPKIYSALFESFAKKLYEKTLDKYYLGDISGIFTNKEKMLEAFNVLSDEATYNEVVKKLGHTIKNFDEKTLTPFYQKMTNAVRLSSFEGIIMMENNYFSNMGIPCGLDRINDEKICFAPHGYDLVVDTPGVGSLSSNGRVKAIFDGHLSTQKRLNAPVIVGEWGAFGHYEDTIPQCKYLISLFEDNLWSNTYWCYHANFDTVPVLKYLKRAYPIAMIGEIISYRYDFENKSFVCKWNEGDITNGKSEVYLPFVLVSNEYEVIKKGEGCIVHIEAIGGMREIEFKQ